MWVFCTRGISYAPPEGTGRLTEEKSSWAFTTPNGDWQERRGRGEMGVITVNVQMSCVSDFAKGIIYLTIRERKGNIILKHFLNSQNMKI